MISNYTILLCFTNEVVVFIVYLNISIFLEQKQLNMKKF